MHLLRILYVSVFLALLPTFVTAQETDSLVNRLNTINAAKYLKSIYKIDEAIDTLSTLVGPTFDEEVLSELADCHYQNGDLENAAGTYLLLTSVNPTNLLYKVRQVAICYKLKAYGQAVEVGKEVLRIDSISAIATLIGDSYNQMEQYDSALVYYNQTLAIKPYNESVVSKVAKIYLDRQEYSEVIAISDAFLKLSPDNINIAPIKALALYLNGQYFPAIDIYEKQLKLGNDTYSIHYYLGQCYWRTLLLYRAERELKAAWQLDSSDVNLAYSIAGVLADANRPFDDVKPWLDKALAMLEPDSSVLSRIHQQYGLGYYKKQDSWDQAIEHYKKAFNYNPQFISALSTIAYCYEQKKEYKSALEWYEKYLAVAKPGSSGYKFAQKSIEILKGELFMEE
jgi:tetratricopeptide (TPR) repeat protein